MSTTATTPRTPVAPKLLLLAIVGVVIAGLASLDRLLANAQEAEVQKLARKSYQDGMLLRRKGRGADAAEAFRKAHVLEPERMEYELALIDSLIAARKLDQAERLMRDALEEEPNDGQANLIAAHLSVVEGKAGEAESYYHRAIYGEWADDSVAQRAPVRMELADFLAARGKREELLAELLPLEEEAGKDASRRLHLAQLFLVAGSPSRAADAYRSLLKQDRKNLAAAEGLGEAELQLGDYRVAHEVFLTAAAQQPDDSMIRRNLDLSSSLMTIDPTPRKLTSMDKYRRSLQILALARSALQSCIAAHPEANSGETEELLAASDRTLAKPLRSGIANEAAESVLAVAGQMSRIRTQACGGEAISPQEESLQLIVEKLAQ